MKVTQNNLYFCPSAFTLNSCSQLSVHFNFYGALWTSLQANHLCGKHTLHVKDDEHIYASMKKKNWVGLHTHLLTDVSKD